MTQENGISDDGENEWDFCLVALMNETSSICSLWSMTLMLETSFP